jgi:hypothetical protein
VTVPSVCEYTPGAEESLVCLTEILHFLIWVSHTVSGF